MTRPNLHDYGLLWGEVSRLEARQSSRRRILSRLTGALLAGGALLGVAAAVGPELSRKHEWAELLWLPGAAIAVVFLAAVGATLGGMVAGVVDHLVEAVARSLDPKLRAFERYQLALTAFDQEEERLAQEGEQRRREAQKNHWTSMDGRTFEQEVAALLRRLGRRVRVQGGAGD